MLMQIAEQTGGQYWRATDLEELIEVYQEIDRLNRPKLKKLFMWITRTATPRIFLTGLGFLALAFLNERIFYAVTAVSCLKKHPVSDLIFLN
jgi:Ca-activated chloride channel homolog